ncbi:hypothetical protein [Nostoc sp. 'Peltigera membranacea cyanobiont' 210A]|uniref:hypothetical protein n=1 Tax=Nostoc sp. 'Peltigera membranacea cyanobiont' 210A TaxID=2014529 RepID=UPI00167D2AE3|nr:hypothetical protein [Nostoc sp. 'Peltigera membranacea cyanobiont' 210A]
MQKRNNLEVWHYKVYKSVEGNLLQTVSAILSFFLGGTQNIVAGDGVLSKEIWG